MSRRASLPGAEELFRKTSGPGAAEPARDARPAPESAGRPEAPSSATSRHGISSTSHEVAAVAPRKAPRHDEKITFYCTAEDLMALERARLRLRSEHGVAADRGKIVRAAVAYVLEDFDARAEDSILLRRLRS